MTPQNWIKRAAVLTSSIVFATGYLVLQGRGYIVAGERVSQLPATPIAQTAPRMHLSNGQADPNTPYPDLNSLGTGFKMVPGIDPTFAVSADVCP